MAEYSSTPPSFPGVSYTAGTMNIGSGYAEGIKTAGEGISKGITAAMDVMNRRQNATDMLNALHQGGMLSDDQFKSVAGKSLGAQEQLLGMYANQWILDEAAKRQASLQRGQGGVEQAVSHAKLLDLINLTRSPTGQPGKAAWAGPAPAPQPQQPQYQYSSPQVGAAAQTAQQYGARPEQLPSMQPAQPATPQNQPVQTAQTSGAPKPPIPGSIRVKDDVTGKGGWKLPSGQVIPDPQSG